MLSSTAAASTKRPVQNEQVENDDNEREPKRFKDATAGGGESAQLPGSALAVAGEAQPTSNLYGRMINTLFALACV